MMRTEMRIDKIFEYKHKLENDLTFEEISKLYREILYSKYETLKEYQQIHQYQLTRDMIDIFTQMMYGRIFDEQYLKDTIKW